MDAFHSSHSPGAMANKLEAMKIAEQLGGLAAQCYVPSVIETTGVFRQETAKFFFRMMVASEDLTEHFTLLQKISIAIQCGNAVAILATSLNDIICHSG